MLSVLVSHTLFSLPSLLQFRLSISLGHENCPFSISESAEAPHVLCARAAFRSPHEKVRELQAGTRAAGSTRVGPGGRAMGTVASAVWPEQAAARRERYVCVALSHGFLREATNPISKRSRSIVLHHRPIQKTPEACAADRPPVSAVLSLQDSDRQPLSLHTGFHAQTGYFGVGSQSLSFLS